MGLMGGGRLKYQESRDYLIKTAKEKTDRGKVVPMEIGVTESGGQEWMGYGDYGGEAEGMLGALGKGGGCWICGGTHFQRECPYKGKGKGKGDVGKGAGIGSSR